MKLKASSISNLTDARYFAAWNVEWVGFCLELGDPNYATPQDIQEIKDWLVGPKIIGEFGVGQSAEAINASIELLQLDGVQVSPFVADSVLDQLTETTIIKEWVLEDWQGMEIFANQCQILEGTVDYFLLNLQKSGMSWKMLQAHQPALELLIILCQQYKIIVAIDCPATELQHCLEVLKPYGLNLQGGAEEKVGMKVFDDLDEVFDVLDEMDVLYD